MKLGPNQKKWIEALKSGKYGQCQGVLSDGVGHCCLGVACEVLGAKKEIKNDCLGSEVTYDGYEEFLPPGMRDLLKLYTDNGDISDSKCFSLYERFSEDLELDRLVNLNDEGKSFEQIAKILETYPELYFKEPA